MAGISKAKRRLKASLQKARKKLHPPAPDPPETPLEADITEERVCVESESTHNAVSNSAQSARSSMELPQCPGVTISEVLDNDEEEGIYHVKEVGPLVACFVALEGEGLAPVWDPRIEDETHEETHTHVNIEEFAAQMQRFHDEEVARERERRKHNDRSKGYTKNSAKTLLRQKKKHDAYAAAGRSFISSFFPIKKRRGENGAVAAVTESSCEHEPVVIYISEDSEDMVIEDVQTRSPSPMISIDCLESQQNSSNSSIHPPQLGSYPDLNPAESRRHLDQLKADANATMEKLAHLDAAERALMQLTWRDRPTLWKAVEGLAKKAKEKKLDVFFRARIVSMVSMINFYLDEELGLSWREASGLAARGEN
ncbi:hypothetical protein PQX77_003017 [Marasmius sp. AFHP31]|nr:hypothetical protein PQX77_003017 [Marasmius sp. AFHP31]